MTKFRIGSTYSHDDYENDMFVLAKFSETDETVLLAILWVDPKTLDTVEAGELEVNKKDIKNWKERKLT